MRLDLETIERLRATPGKSVLLFITDRCPVGCAHCSVDSRDTSPMISDFALFNRLVASLCAAPELELVGISGGEPFVERRGLSNAVSSLAGAGKKIVVYTSGVWAEGKTPAWIAGVLSTVDCVFLSFDSFHLTRLGEQSFIRAAAAVAESGAHLVVQILKEESTLAKARELVRRALGSGLTHEENLIPPLPYGRGSGVFQIHGRRNVSELGTCNAVASGVVRYDGRVAACCNERVIMGSGPDTLRRDCSAPGSDAISALQEFRDDPFLTVLSRLGADTLCEDPALSGLRARKFTGICEFCWMAQGRVGGRRQPILDALSILAESTA